MLRSTNHFWLVEPGRKPRKQAIPNGGGQPIKGGAIVVDGPIGWPDHEVENAIYQVTSMVPQARLVLTPVLALPLVTANPSWLSPEHICDRLDHRPIDTRYMVDMITTDGMCFPELGTIFISLSSTTSPSKIANHEVWHYAETRLLTDKEVALVGMVYGVMSTFFAKAGQPMPCAEPSEWAACAFVQWLTLHTHTMMVLMQPPFETLFHQLASGAMSKRPVLEPRLSIDETYLAIAREHGYVPFVEKDLASSPRRRR